MKWVKCPHESSFTAAASTVEVLEVAAALVVGTSQLSSRTYHFCSEHTLKTASTKVLLC
jgi:hypothetical protein